MTAERRQPGRMLSLDISQAIQSHYPSGPKDIKTRNLVAKNHRTTDLLLNNTLSDQNATQQTFMTMNTSPTVTERDFSQSIYLTQKPVDPNTLLPPCQLSMRNKAENVKKQLSFPASPAFVSIYKMSKEIKLKGAEDFCTENNIPFSTEENNFYRLR